VDRIAECAILVAQVLGAIDRLHPCSRTPLVRYRGENDRAVVAGVAGDGEWHLSGIDSQPFLEYVNQGT
jgi:hypothetical protein